MILRHASLDDLPEIQRLHLQLCESEMQYGFEVSLSWTYSAEGSAYFRHRIQSESSVVSVMTDGAEEVAFLIGSLAQDQIRWAKLASMFVHEAFRRSGVGTRLVRHFLDWSARQGAEKITVAVAAANAAALGLYQKAGFVETARLDDTVILAMPEGRSGN